MKRLLCTIMLIMGSVSLSTNKMPPLAAKQRDVLVDLKSVVVAVDISSNTEEVKWIKQQIQKDIELKLRFAGIKVVSAKDTSLVFTPIFYVNAQLIKVEGYPIYIKTVCVSLSETVYLPRPELVKLCDTWCKESVGYVGVDVFRESVRRSVKSKVDVFINDYLAVNKK